MLALKEFGTSRLRIASIPGLSFGFVTLPVASRVLEVEPWLTTEAVCLLPAAHPLAGKARIDIEDLRDQHLVISNQPSISTNPLLELIARHGIQIAGKTEANIGTISALVANGVGITVMNPVTARDQLSPRDEVVVRPFCPAMTFSFGLVYRGEWKQSRVLAFLRDRGKALMADYRN